MRLLFQGDSTQAERMRIVRQQRDKTLDEIHFQGRRLDRLDYLRHQIQKNLRKALDLKFTSSCKIN